MQLIKVERIIGSTDKARIDTMEIESKLDVLDAVYSVFLDVGMQYSEQTSDKTTKLVFNPHAPVINFAVFQNDNDIFTSESFALESVDNVGGKIINVRLFVSE